MTNYMDIPAFDAAVDSARRAIERLASGHGIPDAIALVARRQGENNLQGHWNSVVPLAVFVVRQRPDLLPVIRQNTDLGHDMGSGSPEARDGAIWDPVREVVSELIRTHGDDIIASTMRSETEQTVERIAQTYLSTGYGGGHEGGGAGDTVLKRALKLLAHLHRDE